MRTAGAEHAPGGQGGSAPARAWSRLGLIALPLLVWYLGSFYLHGDLGKWLDDYGAHVRDPVTGSFEWSRLLRYQWWFFWRPIHLHLIFALQTLLWNHDWLNHLVSALMHAAACFGLWKFLRECGLRAAACAGAALLMLGAPQAFEAIFWPATLSTSIATAAFFWAARIALRHAQNRHRGPAVLVLAVLGFTIPCMYEQPAAALGALPILYLGAARAGAGAIGKGSIRRMLLALGPCGVGVLIYLVATLVSARRDPLTRESQIINAAMLWPRTKYLLWNLGYVLDPATGMGELWRAGMAHLRGSWLGGTGWAALASTCVLGWVARLGNPAGGESRAPGGRADPGDPVPRLWIFLFALGAVLLSLVPVLLIRGAGLSPRLAYFPVSLALVVLAVLMDAMIAACGREPRRARWMRGAIGLAAALGALAGCVVLIGVQTSMQARSRADRAELASLHAMIPNPPPGTLFMPVRIAPGGADPHHDRLRNSFQPIWESPWAANTMIKHEYRRTDVNACALYKIGQSSAIVRLGDPTSISWGHYVWHLPTPRTERICPDFAQDHIVPFVVEASGRVVLVDRITSTHPDGSPAIVEFPLVRSALDGSPTCTVPLAVPIGNGRPWLTDWTWPHRKNAGVTFLRLSSWGASDRAVRMHPATPGTVIDDADSDEMAHALAPGPPRRFVFYATCDEATIDLSILGDGVELTWSLAPAAPGAPAAVLKRETLDPKAIKANRAWKTFDVAVPALDAPRTLTLSVGSGPGGNASYDRIIITCGEDATNDPSTPRKAGKD